MTLSPAELRSLREALGLTQAQLGGSLGVRQLSSFVGRESQIAEVHQLLMRTPLVTLVGPGGVGKTRLALRVAEAALDDFAHAVCVVDLAPITDPQLLVGAVMAALPFQNESMVPSVETLVEAMQSRRMLLVLDNCEHLVQSCADLVEELLRGYGGIRILTTSRQALGVAGEQVRRVAALSSPEPPYPSDPETLRRFEAVALFVERAVAVAPDFALTSENSAAVADVCWRLDGLPLAIELAAARARVLSVEQLAERLRGDFGVLSTQQRRAPPRQQTLRATLEWSYRLLTSEERRVLCRSAVFVGGWSIEAAESVCANHGIDSSAIVDIMDRLVDKSLVQVQSQADRQPRFSLLQTVREFALEQLENSPDCEPARMAHSAWYLALALAAEAELLDAQQHTWFQRLDVEHENIRAALRYFAQGASDADAARAVDGLRLVGALWRFWTERAHLKEGRRWVEEFLTLTGTTSDPEIRGSALFCLGYIAFREGDLSAARDAHEAALRIRRETGSQRLIAQSLHHLGWAHHFAGELRQARALYEESLAIYARADDRSGMAAVLGILGGLALDERDFPHARAVLADSLVIKRELGDSWGAGQSLLVLGLVECEEGNEAQARVCLYEALALGLQLGAGVGLAFVLEGFARLAALRGEPHRVVRLLGAAAALRDRIASPVPPHWRGKHDAWLAELRRTLGEEEFTGGWTAGRGLSVDQAVAEARAVFEDVAEDTGHCPASAAPHGILSAREEEVLRLIASGRTSKEIALALMLSIRTVERHIANIYAKIGARNRADATAYALRRSSATG